MKTITVSDEMYDFLLKTGKNILEQDNRCTREPIVFVIESKCEEMRPEGYAEKQKIVDEEGNEESLDDIVECIMGDLEEVKERMILLVDDDEAEALLQKAKTLEELFEIIDIDYYIRFFRNNWTLVHYDEMFRPKTSEGGFFLTEKAADDHLKINRHHYREPRTYVEYANRNPEIDGIVKFLKEVARKE